VLILPDHLLTLIDTAARAAGMVRSPLSHAGDRLVAASSGVAGHVAADGGAGGSAVSGHAVSGHAVSGGSAANGSAASGGAASGGAASHGAHPVRQKASHSKASGSKSSGSIATGAPTVSAGHMLLQLLLGLGVIVGVLWGGTKLLRGRRGGNGSGPAGRRRGVVSVLGRQTLGKGVSVAVVQVGERAYLLGVTPSEVRRLAEVDAAVADIADRPSSRSMAPAGMAPAVSVGMARLAAKIAPRWAARIAPADSIPGLGSSPATRSGPGPAAGLTSSSTSARTASSAKVSTAALAGTTSTSARTASSGKMSTAALAGTTSASALALAKASSSSAKASTAALAGVGSTSRPLAPSSMVATDARCATFRHAPGRRASSTVTSTGTGDGSARTPSERGTRPAPTWTSAIEHLRERTVRRG